MSIEKIKTWLNHTDLPLTVISRKLNVSRNTLYAWRSGKSEIRPSNVERFLEVFGEHIDKPKGKEIMEMYGGSKEPEQELGYVGLLKDKIKTLQEENSVLNAVLKNNPFSDAVYDSVVPDFITTVELKYENNKLYRCIRKGDFRDLTKNFTPKEIEIYKNALSVDEWFIMDEHPVNKLLCERSLITIQGYTKILGPILNAMKIMVGGGISIPVTYNFPNKYVYTQCYMKIMWWENPKRITTKNVVTKIEHKERQN